MNPKIARSGIAFCLLLPGGVALASLPFATGDTSRIECTEAMKLASAVFQSTTRRLYAPLTLPDDFDSTMILGTTELDISGGDELTSTEAFEKLPRGIRSVYWATEANESLRVVVAETPRGWRGDTYDVYLLDSTLEKNDFLIKLSSENPSSAEPYLIWGAWRPPLVFQHRLEKAKWLIDLGSPSKMLSDWRVYSSLSTKVVCTIAFVPPGSDAVRHLPTSVRRLARKLGETLGPAADRTTTNSHAVLANAAFRPWALADREAYNSREEVDAGLESWAKVNSSRRRLLDEIQREYPKAERSLATYYEREFELQPQESQEVAAWALDLTFRSHFVFPNGSDYFRYEGVRTNPWPLGR